MAAALSYAQLGSYERACDEIRKVFRFDPMEDEERTFGAPNAAPLILLPILREIFHLKVEVDKCQNLDDIYRDGVLLLSTKHWSEAHHAFMAYYEKAPPGVARTNAALFTKIIEAAGVSKDIRFLEKIDNSDVLGNKIAGYLKGTIEPSTLLSAVGHNDNDISRVHLMIGLNQLAKRNPEAAGSHLLWVSLNGATDDDRFIASQLIVYCGLPIDFSK
jgi:hypothetical protein